MGVWVTLALLGRSDEDGIKVLASNLMVVSTAYKCQIAKQCESILRWYS